MYFLIMEGRVLETGRDEFGLLSTESVFSVSQLITIYYYYIVE